MMQAPPTRYLTITQIRQRLGGISRMSLHRYRGKGQEGRRYLSMGFPEPAIHIAGRPMWLEADLAAWEASQRPGAGGRANG